MLLLGYVLSCGGRKDLEAGSLCDSGVGACPFLLPVLSFLYFLDFLDYDPGASREAS